MAFKEPDYPDGMPVGLQKMKSIKKKKHKRKHRSLAPPPKKHKMRHVWLNVLPDDLWLKVRRGKTVWEALVKEGVDTGGECGGLGKCGKCKIKVVSSIGMPTEEEKRLLNEEELRAGVRLACRTEIRKDLVISIGEEDAEKEYFQILKSGHRPLHTIDPLVRCQPIALAPSPDNGGLASVDRVKLAIGPNYEAMTPSLYCLKKLPEIIEASRFNGAAVLYENSLIECQSQQEAETCYGLVFDLGTSTLVGKLISLSDGSEMAVASCLNDQFKYGADIISRLHYIKEHTLGLKLLHDLLVKDLNRITRRLVKAIGIEQDDIFVAVAAGNTTMQHILLGLNPLGIAEAPFSPVVTDGLALKAADVDLALHPEALLHVMPTKTGYIGGDLISVIIASGAAEQDDEVVLGVDFGTNGEIFLGNSRRLMTCSAAAGPALEGANISHGMIARAGAIEAFKIDGGGLGYHIIGNIKPKGICGSGLVDLVAVLLHCGIIDYEGMIQPSHQGSGCNLSERVVNSSEVYDFLIASEQESHDQRSIYLTQRDVRQLQLAKGAVAAGIKTLMDDMGIGVGDIDRVYLAGALGNYVNPYSAIRIGLIPMVAPGIVSSLGNAAATGASMVLLSRDYWHEANEMVDFIEHVELSSRLDFNQYFIEHLDFPRENIW